MSNPFFTSASEELGRAAESKYRSISLTEHHDRAAQALATLAVAYEKQTENMLKLHDVLAEAGRDEEAAEISAALIERMP